MTIQISNPNDRLRIKQQIEEAVALSIQISDKRGQLTDVINLIHTDFGIDKKQIRLAIKTRLKRNKQEVLQDFEDFDTLYDTIFKDELDTDEEDDTPIVSLTVLEGGKK